MEPRGFSIRPLLAADLDAVVALDARITGVASRRGYFEKRLESALRHPKAHLQLAAMSATRLVGFTLARLAGGEYGSKGAAAVLETIGVDPAARGKGLGRRMLASVEERAQGRDARSVVTQVDWRNHSMLQFCEGAGFALAPRQILERRVHRMPLPATDEEIEKAPPLVRHLRVDDFDMVARIDRMATGDDRAAYLRRKFDEVLEESAIEVSLVAEDDGFVVAFVMARVDLGDFGHVEPTASLDTIGVNTGLLHRGFARAVLTQLIDNLAALHVDNLETEVAREGFDLLRFLYRFGFTPSPRLPFEKRLVSRV